MNRSTKNGKVLADANRDYEEAQSRMAMLPSYYRWIYRDIRQYLTGDVVELGCGAGFGIGTYLDRAARVYAVDHDPALLKQIRDRYPGERVTPINMDLLSDWSALGDTRADAVILMDLLEHIEDELDLLCKIRGALRTGGYLLLKVPAQSRLYSPMDVASGHFRRYDKEDLKEEIEGAGFDQVSVRYINRLGALAYRRRRQERSNFSRSFSPLQLRVINSLVPVLSLVDNLIPLKGLSLIGVFRKR